MNSNQAIRFYINKYGTMIHIDDLYTKMKLKVFKIKKATELTEENKKTIAETFNAGIKALQQGVITKKEAREDIMLTLNKTS